MTNRHRQNRSRTFGVAALRRSPPMHEESIHFRRAFKDFARVIRRVTPALRKMGGALAELATSTAKMIEDYKKAEKQ